MQNPTSDLGQILVAMSQGGNFNYQHLVEIFQECAESKECEQSTIEQFQRIYTEMPMYLEKLEKYG